MKVKNLAIEKLVPYENNPRNNDAAVDYVANSIKEFGFQVPIVVDKDNVIVAGHTRYKTAGNSLVVKKIDNVYSHCEHHLALMYNMSVVVAYLPTENKDGTYNVIGLSKIPRIVELCCKRLQLQERIAADISECIRLATGSPDVYVNIIADHACVSARGAKNEGLTDVTNLSGRFISNPDLRNEIERKIKYI